MEISEEGGGVALSLAFPMFWFPGVERGGWCVPLVFLARAVCVLEGGVGGMVGYKVATLGMMLLAMVLMLAGVAKPGQY